jgi:LCP family protein required for cell wall assembly
MDEQEDRSRWASSFDEVPPAIYHSRRRVLPRLRRPGPRKPRRPAKIKGGRRSGAPRRRRRWPWVVGVTALVLLLVVAGFGLWFFMSLKFKESRMRVAAVDSSLKKHGSGPETTLIMGTDHGSVPGEAGPGRSDVMMLLTTAPDGKYAGFISIPRDSRVPIPGHKGYDKINAAHAYGGPQLAIKTVEAVTGLDVNHYVEINFEGFKQIVNAIGGVRMNIPHAIHDKFAGDVPAGDVVLNGDQALALVRARYDVAAVPNGDVDRTKNQRAFIEALLSSVAHQRDPFKVLKIADAVSTNAKTDMTFWKMFTLGRKLQSLKKGGNLETVIAPGQPKFINRVWYYILDTSQFNQILARFEGGAQGTEQASSTEQSTTDSAQVRVKVLNGTRTRGLATSVSKELSGRGYEKITTGNAVTRYSKTTVYYAPGYDEAAQKLASEVGGSPDVSQNEDVTTQYDSDVVVVIGSDHL